MFLILFFSTNVLVSASPFCCSDEDARSIVQSVRIFTFFPTPSFFSWLVGKDCSELQNWNKAAELKWSLSKNLSKRRNIKIVGEALWYKPFIAVVHLCFLADSLLFWWSFFVLFFLPLQCCFFWSWIARWTAIFVSSLLSSLSPLLPWVTTQC